MIFVVFIDG